MKTLLLILLLALLVVCCHDTVDKNRKTIDAVVKTRAVSRSVEVKSYDIDNKIETPDSLTLFITVHPSAGNAFADTLRFAKTGDGIINP
jgi:hypothetical protein